MSYLMGQVTVPNASTVPVLTLPPGLASANVWASTAASIYMGTSVNVSPSKGCQVSTVPTGFSQFVSSSGAQLYAANTSATSGVFFYSLTTGA